MSTDRIFVFWVWKSPIWSCKNLSWKESWMCLWNFHKHGFTTTINGEPYAAILTNFLILNLKIHRMASQTIFQQDDALPHLCKTVKKIYPTRLILKGYPSEWPAYSPDLNFFGDTSKQRFSWQRKTERFWGIETKNNSSYSETTPTHLD